MLVTKMSVFLVRFLLPSGDGWTVPAAGAVFMAAVVFALPLKNGRPILSLQNDPRFGLPTSTPTLRRLRHLDAAGLVEVESQDVTRHADQFFSGSANEEGSWEWGSDGASTQGDSVLVCTDQEEEEQRFSTSAEVAIVDPTMPENVCHTCVECGGAIGGGTCLIQFRVAGSIHNMHSACCGPWAVQAHCSTDMMTSLVAAQETALPNVHGIINMVVYELLDLTRLNYNDNGIQFSQPPSLGPLPPSTEAAETVPASIGTVEDSQADA